MRRECSFARTNCVVCGRAWLQRRRRLQITQSSLDILRLTELSRGETARHEQLGVGGADPGCNRCRRFIIIASFAYTYHTTIAIVVITVVAVVLSIIIVIIFILEAYTERPEAFVILRNRGDMVTTLPKHTAQIEANVRLLQPSRQRRLRAAALPLLLPLLLAVVRCRRYCWGDRLVGVAAVEQL